MRRVENKRLCGTRFIIAFTDVLLIAQLHVVKQQYRSSALFRFDLTISCIVFAIFSSFLELLGKLY